MPGGKYAHRAVRRLLKERRGWEKARRDRTRWRKGRPTNGLGPGMVAEAASKSYPPSGVTEPDMGLLGSAPAKELVQI